MTGVISLVLERDGHDQPWGFRLQGGTDVAMPLSVQRVLVGSPADGTLLKGDVITRISCTETKGITHQQAADLFNNAGNQIAINIKRAGVTVLPAGAQASTPLVNGGPGQASVSVAGQTSPNPSSEPYRTLPLVQPTAKVYAGGDLGAGSIVHLKMQDEHITGVREPKASPETQNLAAKAKHDEIVMKHKVAGSLQQIQQSQQFINSGRLPSPNFDANKQYNNPLPLYSQENVQEAMQAQVSPSHTPTINPVNKPQKHLGLRGMPLTYDPEQSATWQIINEEENCHLITEHGPTESKVYSI